MATATLALRRKGRVFGRRHARQILPVGKQNGPITDADTAGLPAEAGHHTLRLSSGRFTDPERSFDAADGQVVSYTCHAPLIWPRRFLLAARSGRHRHLRAPGGRAPPGRLACSPAFPRSASSR